MLIKNINGQYSSEDKEFRKAVKEIFQQNSPLDFVGKYEANNKNIQSFKAEYINKKRGRKTKKIIIII